MKELVGNRRTVEQVAPSVATRVAMLGASIRREKAIARHLTTAPGGGDRNRPGCDSAPGSGKAQYGYCGLYQDR